MTIKELMVKLDEFDCNDIISIDPKSLRIYNQKYDWYSYIQFEKSENTKQSTYEKNIEYLKMCLGIVYGGKTFDFKTIDMIISLFQLIDKKKEETDLQSICEIIKDVQNRFENKTI
jgi:hypothetical protein